MLDRGVCLRWYKQPEVQDEMIRAAMDREVAIKYSESGFGKRPDTLVYPKDVLELAKKGATSFHCSEERWENPLLLSANLTQKQLDGLRIGWDLVLDIDCPYWKYSKLITKLCIELLRGFGIRSLSVKFSGNKGFHIGIPFEAFPKRFRGIPTAALFPEAPRRIALFISNLLEKPLLEALGEKEREEIASLLNKSKEEVFVQKCSRCGAIFNRPEHRRVEFICPSCNTVVPAKGDTGYMICKRCNKIMEKKFVALGKCPHCGSKEPPKESFDLSKILKIDTVLLSSRHLYRMVYSLHEGSGLVSIPVELDKVEGFEKEMANPAKARVNPKLRFLDTTHTESGEATSLLLEAYDFAANSTHREELKPKREYEIPKTPVSSELFPPCINNILKGLEDGRKRSLFILLTFLS
ncbi:hypothetical protein KY318_04035, partial [Candidatus Woesearchaeota archaeon]|nr:hypothetical protein [Candidatus Woesearchaeota archaeon]